VRRTLDVHGRPRGRIGIGNGSERVSSSLRALGEAERLSLGGNVLGEELPFYYCRRRAPAIWVQPAVLRQSQGLDAGVRQRLLHRQPHVVAGPGTYFPS